MGTWSQPQAGAAEVARALDQKWEVLEISRLAVDTAVWERLGGGKLEPLLGHVDLVDLKYVVEKVEVGQPVPRWQEVPRGARINSTNLFRIQRCIGGGRVLSVLVLSYPWLDKVHPDLQLRTMRRLLPCFKAFLDAVNELGDEWSTVGLLMDYMCLPQHCMDGTKRTAEEEVRFKKGLHTMNSWYLHSHTNVVIFDVEMPAEESGHTNLKPHSNRGWCVFEKRASSMVKHTNCLWSLRGFEVGGSCHEYTDAMVHGTVGVVRPAPVVPEEFDKRLDEGIATKELNFTCGDTDIPVVKRLYREAFEAAFDGAIQLDFSQLGWKDEQMKTLAAALVRTRERRGLAQCKKVDVRDNPCSKAGLRALAEALKGTTCEIWAKGTGCCKAGHEAVRKALRDTGVKVVLDKTDL